MKRKPITTRLFKIYTSLFMVFYTLIISCVIALISVDINKNIIETQKQMTQTISKSIEQYFQEMNSFSMDLMNSHTFKKAAIQELPQAYDEGSSMTISMQYMYAEAYKLFEKEYCVGVAANSGHYIWMGDRIIVEKYDEGVSTYANYDGYGKPVLLLLEKNEYLASLDNAGNTFYSEKSMLTLSRSINVDNRFSAPQAILEVQKSQDDFSGFVSSLSRSSNAEAMNLWVYNADGMLLYGDNSPPDFYSAGAPYATVGWQRSGGTMVQVSSIFASNAYIVYEIPVKYYYQKLISFGIAAAVFSLLLCCLIIIVTYRVSKSFSRPINQMSKQLESIDLSKKLAFEKVDTDIYELDLLAETVNGLNQRLELMMDDIISLKTGELQSTLMALQAQMQPHFLYNTLTNICTLAENNDNEAVVEICHDLSKMLRYVSSKNDGGVELYEEIDFLNSYSDIMLQRFPKAKILIDVPLEMMEIKIPKLVLQPIVENSFKYSGRTDTKINIKAWVEKNNWYMRIQDNGVGFSEKTVQDIKQRCKNILNKNEMLSAQINGMGLVNIYARLALCYKNSFHFLITPSADGAIIDIGGYMNG